LILDLNIPFDRNKAEVYFQKLLDGNAKIEIKRIAKRRTLSQNNYVHKLFTLYGGEFGWSTEEAKAVIKRELGYVYEKDGQKFLMHTSDMNTKELTEFIDRFRNLSAHQGCYLPTPDEFSENYVEMMKQVEAIESQQKRYTY
jgi:mitochondrial fission protein ELM1